MVFEQVLMGMMDAPPLEGLEFALPDDFVNPQVPLEGVITGYGTNLAESGLGPGYDTTSGIMESLGLKYGNELDSGLRPDWSTPTQQYTNPLLVQASFDPEVSGFVELSNNGTTPSNGVRTEGAYAQGGVTVTEGDASAGIVVGGSLETGDTDKVLLSGSYDVTDDVQVGGVYITDPSGDRGDFWEGTVTVTDGDTAVTGGYSKSGAFGEVSRTGDLGDGYGYRGAAGAYEGGTYVSGEVNKDLGDGTSGYAKGTVDSSGEEALTFGIKKSF